MSKLSEKIYYCRKKSGKSQEALAEQIGVSRQAISKWENGDAEPEISKLRLLAGAFDVSVDWLLSDDDPKAAAADAPAPAQAPQAANWVESIPGVTGRLLRRFGWLFGVYLAVAGAGFAALGALARTMSRRMLSGFSGAFFDSPFGGTVSGLAANNPVSILGTAIMAVGLFLLLAGVILALILKKRSAK